MEPIKRTGPPRAVATRGKEFTWSVPLSGAYSSTWISAFQDPGQWTTLVHPRQAQLGQGEVRFTCEDHRVEEWVTAIDRWIETGNAVVAHEEEEAKKRHAIEESRRRDEL